MFSFGTGSPRQHNEYGTDRNDDASRTYDGRRTTATTLALMPRKTKRKTKQRNCMCKHTEREPVTLLREYARWCGVVWLKGKGPGQREGKKVVCHGKRSWRSLDYLLPIALAWSDQNETRFVGIEENEEKRAKSDVEKGWKDVQQGREVEGYCKHINRTTIHRWKVAVANHRSRDEHDEKLGGKQVNRCSF